MRRIHTWCGAGIVVALVPGRAVAAYGVAAGGGLALFGLIMAALGALFAWLLRGRGARPKLAYLYRPRGRRLDTFTVSGAVCRIGRHPSNELRLPNKAVSRFHAELVRNPNGTFSVHDNGSRNGIRVGLRPVRSSILKEGDSIDLGGVRLRFSRRPRDYNVHGNTVLLPRSSNRYDTRRRRDARARFNAEARLYNDETGWVNGWIRDVGRGGAFIETELKLPSRLPLDILVAVAGKQKRKWLHLTGEIAWSDGRGIGVSFTDRDPAQVQQLLDAAA